MMNRTKSNASSASEDAGSTEGSNIQVSFLRVQPESIWKWLCICICTLWFKMTIYLCKIDRAEFVILGLEFERLYVDRFVGIIFFKSYFSYFSNMTRDWADKNLKKKNAKTRLPLIIIVRQLWQGSMRLMLGRLVCLSDRPHFFFIDRRRCLVDFD